MAVPIHSPQLPFAALSPARRPGEGDAARADAVSRRVDPRAKRVRYRCTLELLSGVVQGGVCGFRTEALSAEPVRPGRRRAFDDKMPGRVTA